MSFLAIETLATLARELADVALLWLAKARTAGTIAYRHAYYEAPKRDGTDGTVVVIMDDHSDAGDDSSLEMIKGICLQDVGVDLQIIPSMPEFCDPRPILAQEVTAGLIIRRLRLLAVLPTAEHPVFGMVEGDGELCAVARYNHDNLSDLDSLQVRLANKDTQAAAELATQLASQNRAPMSFVINDEPITVQPGDTVAAIMARCPVMPEKPSPLLPAIFRAVAQDLIRAGAELLAWQPGDDLPKGTCFGTIPDTGEPAENPPAIEAVFRFRYGFETDLVPESEDGGDTLS